MAQVMRSCCLGPCPGLETWLGGPHPLLAAAGFPHQSCGVTSFSPNNVAWVKGRRMRWN